MCERYVIPEQPDVEREFRVAHPWWKFKASFNVSSRRSVPVIRDFEGEPEGVMLQWGLIPDWAEGDASKGCIAHASAEDVAASTLTRGAWARGQRCILPAFGFYGWRRMQARHYQPYFIRVVNRAVFGIAALWDRTVDEDADDVIESCAMLTVPPNHLVAEVNTAVSCMPAILHRDDYEAWLHAPPADAAALLRAYPDERIIAHEVSPRVNSLSYDDPGLISRLCA